MDNNKIVQQFLCYNRPCFQYGKCIYEKLKCREAKLMKLCLDEKDASFANFLVAHTGTLDAGDEAFKEYKLWEHI